VLQVSAPRPAPAATAAAGGGAGGPRIASRKGGANWKHKHVVIDAINDLIDELEHITTSITVQVGTYVCGSKTLSRHV
jgi:hypothetical protein